MFTILGASTLQALINLMQPPSQTVSSPHPDVVPCPVSEFSVHHPGFQKLN